MDAWLYVGARNVAHVTVERVGARESTPTTAPTHASEPLLHASFRPIRSIQGGAAASQAGIAVTFEGTVYGWGNNYMGVMALAPKVVHTPTMLPIPCPVSRALLGMSGQQVLGQSVDGSQMVRPCCGG